MTDEDSGEDTPLRALHELPVPHIPPAEDLSLESSGFPARHSPLIEWTSVPSLPSVSDHHDS